MTSNQAQQVLSSSALPAHLLKRPAGSANPGQTLRVALRLHPRGGDDALYARVARLGAQAPAQRQHMDGDMLRAEFAPSVAALDAVRAFCADHGFKLDRTAFGGLFVTVVGKAGDLARAFGVELAMYHFEDRQFRGYTGSIALPATLAPHVAAVIGLDEVSTLASRRAAQKIDCTVDMNTMQSNPPITVANDYYQYPTQFSGKGATVALIESYLELDMENITAFFSSLDETVRLEVIRGMREMGDPFCMSRFVPPKVNGEAMLDIKLTGAVAPGSTLVVYGQEGIYGYSCDGWIDSLMAALDRPAFPCHVMSISLGMPESNWPGQLAQSIHFLFALAALQGVTVCVSSGDYGALGDASGAYAQNCAFPATSPFCLACGGTELLVSQERALQGEVVWNELNAAYEKCATGGGLSTLFELPDFQQGLAMPESFNSNMPAGRGIPDVAGNAALSSGYALEPDNTGNFYGTSAAAPMWAALIARLIEGNGGKGLGYLNPWLYAGQVYGSASYCKPITQGNNGAPDSGVVFSAADNNVWNACCGLGSPLGGNIANGLGIDTSEHRRS
ncbi:MAG TPA: S53 family peptidase [Bordetella sp.]|nr:S53 family peptidase [Bordetella sp.]